MGFKTVGTLDTPKLMGNKSSQTVNIIPVANRAYLVRAWTGRYMVPKFFSFIFRTAAGNVDFGVYDLSFNRIWSTGLTAMAALGAAPQYNYSIAASNFRTLKPGAYWLAVTFDSGAARFDGVASGNTIGSLVAFKDASFPLPASLAGATLSNGGAVDAPALALGTL